MQTCACAYLPLPATHARTESAPLWTAPLWTHPPLFITTPITHVKQILEWQLPEDIERLRNEKRRDLRFADKLELMADAGGSWCLGLSRLDPKFAEFSLYVKFVMSWGFGSSVSRFPQPCSRKVVVRIFIQGIKWIWGLHAVSVQPRPSCRRE